MNQRLSCRGESDELSVLIRQGFIFVMCVYRQAGVKNDVQCSMFSTMFNFQNDVQCSERCSMFRMMFNVQNNVQCSEILRPFMAEQNGTRDQT